MSRRIEHCISPGKRETTNLRLKAYFDEAVKRGDRVEMEILDFDPFHINNVTFSTDLLGHTNIRRMLENLALVWLHASAVSGQPVILNQVFTQEMERRKRRLDTAVAGLKKLGLRDAHITRVVQAQRINNKPECRA